MQHSTKKKINFGYPFELKTCENCHFWFWQLKRNSATPVSKKLLIFCLHSTFSRSFLDVDVDFLAKVDYPHENTRILFYTLLFYSFHLCIRITSVIFCYLVDSILYFRLLYFLLLKMSFFSLKLWTDLLMNNRSALSFCMISCLCSFLLSPDASKIWLLIDLVFLP